MAKCIFENLSPEQAQVFADWYEGQGEQNSQPWFDEHKLKTPYIEYYKIMENGDIVVKCKTIEEEDDE